MLRILILTNIRSAEYPTDLEARVGTGYPAGYQICGYFFSYFKSLITS